MGKKVKQEDIDNGVYGKPLQYDANFYGPRAKRSCTDIICFLLFFCFLVVWIIVGVIALSQGDPAKIIAPTDSNGRRCGYDEEVIDKKYLFYFDITQCSLGSCKSPTVCVDKCPDEVYIGAYYILSGAAETAQQKAICRREKPTAEGMAVAIQNKECTAWYIPYKSVARRCIYADINKALEDELTETIFKDFTDLSYGEILDSANELQDRVKKVGETIVSDMEKNWPLLLGGLVVAMVLCMIYIVIMRWFAWIIVWVSLIGVLALLAFCCYITWTKYVDARDDEVAAGDPANDAVKISWLIFFIASCIVLVVVLLLIIFLRNRIRIATALITEASRAVGSIMSTLLFPLVPWLLQMGVIAWTVAVWLYIVSSGLPAYEVRDLNKSDCNCQPYSDGDSCELETFNEKCSAAISSCPEVTCAFKTYESRAYAEYFHALNIIGFFWVLCFISAFSDMALAGTFSTWYWTFKKSDVPFLALTWSIGRTLRYHIGTLAFGSLILAICRLIRVTLEYVDAHLRRYDNGFVKCVMCCFKCFFWCLEKFIKFINRNAYIMCAIHGKNFCRSAHKGFNLVMRNIIRVFVVDKVTDFLLLLGKLLITGGMVALAFYIFSNNVEVDEENDIPVYTYYLLPVIIVGIGTYFVTCIFFSVYHMAVDTIFLCFLEDLERNDGSVEKPYYMSKNLLKILGKKNQKYKEQ